MFENNIFKKYIYKIYNKKGQNSHVLNELNNEIYKWIKFNKVCRFQKAANQQYEHYGERHKMNTVYNHTDIKLHSQSGLYPELLGVLFTKRLKKRFGEENVRRQRTATFSVQVLNCDRFVILLHP